MARSALLRLRRSEPVTTGLRRILLGRVTQAQRCLGSGVVAELQIHELRRQIKQARAALRLLRSGLTAAEYRGLDEALSRSARRWGGQRDREVLAVLLAKMGLGIRPGGALGANPPRTPLREIVSARRELRGIESRVRGIRLPAANWSLLVVGLQRSYRRGRAAMRTAQAADEDVQWHHWRRDAKYLALQLELLQSWRSPLLGQLAHDAAQLERVLGEDHDLAVLLDHVRELTGFTDTHLSDINGRRERLKQQALDLGRRLYASRLRKLRGRLHRDWRHWR